MPSRTPGQRIERDATGPETVEAEDLEATHRPELSDEALDVSGEAVPAALTDEQIEEVTRLLRAGRRLPPHLFPHLFEAPREYELSYRGKARRVDVLADTMAMPLQPVRTFGEQREGWSNLLVFGDNLQVLRQLINLKAAGKLTNEDGSLGVRACYIDPPFASEREFSGPRNERAYADRVAGAEFVEHLRRRLILIYELLADNGSLFVHLDTRKVHYMKVVLDELFGEGNFRNEIIWKRTGAHSGAHRYAPVHETLLFYSKSDAFIWNRGYHERVEEGGGKHYRSVDSSGRRWEAGELTAPGIRRGESGAPWRGFDPAKMGRHWAKSPNELDELDIQGRIYWPKKSGAWPRLIRYLDEVQGLAFQDVWTDIPPVNMNASERVGYPTQKPLALLKRVIQASTDSGDLILDAFVGSGTTLLAAQQLDAPRRWIGIDSGKFAIYVTQARLLRAAGKRPPANAFTLYNAGLYDYRSLRELPWERYRDFVLQLFQCRQAEFSLGGVEFHGYIGGDPVLVYDYKRHPDARIGEDFVDDLARLCGARLGTRCFIIAPASGVDLYEDYVDVTAPSGSKTRFFFLRIPYSIIAELHKKAFTELRQPTSEFSTNAPIDSVGFDFVVPPRVDCSYQATGPDLIVQIRAFESGAFAAAESAENIADLAMVLVDHDYDGEVFDLDAVHFSEDLAKTGWRFTIPAEAAGLQVLIVYVDVFGNEHRELKRRADFAARPVRARRDAASSARRLGRAT